MSDPRGLHWADPDCGPGWIGDASESGPCCPPGNSFAPDPSVDPACYSGGGTGGGGGASAPEPKCWQNRININATLNNLGSNILAKVASAFSGEDLQILETDISADSSSELASISGTAPPGSPAYIGGHFNLNLTAGQISQFSAGDQAIFAADFAGSTSDGVRQSATAGLAGVLGYFLHSQVGKKDPGIAAGEYSFHFDRFNPEDAVGLAGHFGYDVLGGHFGHPCLDPVWHH